MHAAPARLPLPTGLISTRILVIMRRCAPADVIERAGLLAARGITAVELTLDSPDAASTIETLRGRYPALHVGAGTVRTEEDLRRAVSAGAQFAVCPHTDPSLIELATDLGLPSLPGAATASEAVAAWNAGASAVKLFPAEPAGPGLLAALRQPLPDIPFVPTGGITGDNAAQYFGAGAAALAVGGALTGRTPERMAADAADLLRLARQAGPWR